MNEKFQFPREEKICMVVKINFHGGKNHGHRTSFTTNASQSNESVTSFTANTSQSNESVTCARVACTEVCWCHRGRKLIFITVGIDF